MISGFYSRLRYRAEELVSAGKVEPSWLTTLNAIEKETRKREVQRSAFAFLLVLAMFSGAALIGGLLLFIGSRWSDYSPTAHLILGSSPLAASALFGYLAICRFSKRQLLMECAALFCSLGSLICFFTFTHECQIIYVGTEMIVLATWMILPFIYVFNGLILCLIETALLVTLLFLMGDPAEPLFQILALMPYLIFRIVRHPASAAARWTQGVFIVLLAAWWFFFCRSGETLSLPVWFATLISIGLPFGEIWKKQGENNLFRSLGTVACVAFAAAASFSASWQRPEWGFRLHFHHGVWIVLLLALCLYVAVFAATLKQKKQSWIMLPPLLLLPLSLLSCCASPALMAWLMGFDLTAFALIAMFVSLRKSSVRGIIFSGILLFGLGFAHFWGSGHAPKPVEGILFILCGVLFGGMLFYAKRRFEEKTQGSGENDEK